MIGASWGSGGALGNLARPRETPTSKADLGEMRIEISEPQPRIPV